MSESAAAVVVGAGKDSASATPTPTTVIGDPRVLNINVGILGHVDSGKTSLVKALSTTLSTAALDKHPQSQQRGITLDLGFSAFTLPLPKRFQEHTSITERYDYLQFTLVDCPGHASLIRTIIGGAQIIDMIVLVIDVTKGIQTQTAECIVIGEITSDNVLIALNKIDLLPEDQREEKIQKMTRRIRKTLIHSKFAHADIIPVSAVVGGEKVAAQLSSAPSVLSSSSSNGSSSSSSITSLNMSALVEHITRTVRIPSEREVLSHLQPFYFAVDHCFAVKGHGTVLTGTVLSGSVSVNQIIEIPVLQSEKKVKSMQMFRKNVKRAKQGDRVGICVTNLDPTSIERGFLCTPHTVPSVSAVICLVRRVRFCKISCRSGSKMHVSLGHHTILATVTFFGAETLNTEGKPSSSSSSSSVLSNTNDNNNNTKKNSNNTNNTNSNANNTVAAAAAAAMAAAYQQSFPPISYSPHLHYPWQEELIGHENAVYGQEPLQWALVQFPHPLFVPDHALVIGSRLDADMQDHMCRLAFYGPVRYSFLTPSNTAGTTNTNANHTTTSSSNNNHVNKSSGNNSSTANTSITNANTSNSSVVSNVNVNSSINTTVNTATNTTGTDSNTVSTTTEMLTCPRIADRLLNEHVHIYHVKQKECEVYRILDQRRRVVSDTTNTTNTCISPDNASSNTDLNANSTNNTNNNIPAKAASSTVKAKQKAAEKQYVDGNIHVFEVIVWKLVKEHASLTPFLGLKLIQQGTNHVGVIASMYDNDKLRVVFPGTFGAINVQVGMKLTFPYKRYVFFNLNYDQNPNHTTSSSSINQRHMVQSDDLFPTNIDNYESLSVISGSNISWEVVYENEANTSSVSTAKAHNNNGAKKKAKKAKIENEQKDGNTNIANHSITTNSNNGTTKVGDKLETLSITSSSLAPNQSLNSNTAKALANSMSMDISTTNSADISTNASTLSKQESTKVTQNVSTIRIGKIESVKPATANGEIEAIVSGAFRMEENIKKYVSDNVILATVAEESNVGGDVLGPFGKLGKCKVKFVGTVRVDEFVTFTLSENSA